MQFTTANLKLPRAPRWLDRMPPALLVAVLVFVVAGGIAAVGRYTTRPAIAVQPTPPLPIILIATPQLVPPTPAAVVAAVLPRFVVCYDQPVNGAVLGPIPAPGASGIVARYGAAWVMTPWDGGYCWLRAADVGLPAVADLEPTAAPPQPQVVYVAAQAAPTPAPEQYQIISTPPTMAPQTQAILDRGAWAVAAATAQAGR